MSRRSGEACFALSGQAYSRLREIDPAERRTVSRHRRTRASSGLRRMGWAKHSYSADYLIDSSNFIIARQCSPRAGQSERTTQ
ncbi:MAG: hypothetical protein ACE5HA_17560, partial [Anaerolineae bacterium]